MALFTDGPASTMEDLAAQDSQLLNVASAEGIDITVKLALAHEAIGIEIEELLRRGSGFRLSQVVVTPAMRLWHTNRTLEFVYRDAYNSQLNDRYAGKRDQFRELSKWAYDRVIQAGLGIAVQPVPKAGAPTLLPMPGALPNGAYFVAIAWVNPAGEEGACSTTASIDTETGGFLAIPPAPPDGAVGWNVYAGSSADAMTRQNASPLAPGVEWAPAALTSSGARPGEGQAPNDRQATETSAPIAHVLQRG
jgi:hypothetical protein